jgi:hypothetical protein
VGQSPTYPALATASVNLGTTYANQTIRLRFRLGADQNTGAAGWFVDNLTFSGLANTPFLGVVADPGPCTPVAVEPNLPGEISFAVLGGNPVSGRTGFRYALPRRAQVRITVHDVSGRRVGTVVDGVKEAGMHTAWWGTAETGTPSPPGVYFARMTADGVERKQRIVVLSR